MVGRSLETERSEGDLVDAFPAQGPLRAEHLLQRDVDVRGDVQIQVAVAVGVEESGSGVPAGRLDTRLRGDVLEGAVAAVAIEHVGAEVREQDVGPAVAVVVGHRDATSPPALAPGAGAVGDVLEGAAAAGGKKTKDGEDDTERGHDGEPAAMPAAFGCHAGRLT